MNSSPKPSRANTEALYDSLKEYGLVFEEAETMRIGLAERLRKLPLGFFSKRDLADLTETIMGDVNRMEHVRSHVLGYLYGGYICYKHA